MKKFLPTLLLLITFLTSCNNLPSSIDAGRYISGSQNQSSNNDFISSIDIIIVSPTLTNTSPDIDVYFDMFFKGYGNSKAKTLLGEFKKISNPDNFKKERATRMSFIPVLNNIRIEQLENFIIKNSGTEKWAYKCVVVIVNKRRVLFSYDGVNRWLEKGSTYTVDRDTSKSEHLKIDKIHDPTAIRAAMTTPQNISVITTTADMSSADTDDNIYIKFVADSSLPDLVLPDYFCEPTANEYLLNTSNNNFEDGQTDYFSLSSRLVPASFTKTQLTFREDSNGKANDWIFSSILVLAGGDVAYYRDFASEPITINNKIKEYRYLGENGGKIWIYKYPEPQGMANGYTIAILPDTQGYTVRSKQSLYHTSNSDLGFYRQIEWVVDNMYSRNIKYVAHMGDLIEGYGKDLLKWDFKAYTTQWKCAAGAMNILSEAGIPFGILPGNHDEDSSINLFHNSYKDFFPISNYSNIPGFVGNLDGMTNNAWEIQFDNKRYLFINIEDLGSPVGVFNSKDRKNIQNWMKDILSDYRGNNDRVVLSTHSFVKIDGSYYENAYDMLEGVLTDTINGIQKKNDNKINLILCGHIDGVVYVPGTEISLKSGITINYPPVILSNFQGEYDDSFKQTTYGNGWMRILTFPYDNNFAEVSTFSVLDYTNHTMSSNRIESGLVPENRMNTVHNYENFEFIF